MKMKGIFLICTLLLTKVEFSKIKQLLKVTQQVVAKWGFNLRQSDARVHVLNCWTMWLPHKGMKR